MLGFLNRSHSSDASSLKHKASNTTLNGTSQQPDGSVLARKPDVAHGLTSPRIRPITPARTVSGFSMAKRITKQFAPIIGFNRSAGVSIKEENTVVRQRCEKELGSHVEASVFDTSFDGLHEWIRSERLIRVPHKGGHWDRVLIKVQHFADQVQHLTEAMDCLTEDCIPASQLMFGHCLLLLELGHENANALEKAFHLFYQFGLELVPLLRCVEFFGASPAITDSVSCIFSDLLNIVTAVAITFYRAVHSGRESTTVDVYRSFRSQIEMFHSHISQTTYAMWSFSLSGDDEADRHKLETLQRYLSPQDSVLEFLAAKHINVVSQPEQFTCTWFQSHLTNFIRGGEHILLVEGKSGSGKTTLANWTLDRMQRPVGRKTLTTLSFFFNPNVIGQNTGLSLVKTLLYQLLFQRIGDTRLFNAIEEVVTKSLFLQGAEEQEKKLWGALTKSLSHLEHTEGDALVVVVDGVDGISEQKAALQRLYDLTKHVSAVRLIQFSQPYEQSLKHSVHLHITTDTLRNDMTTIARRRLMLHPQFNDLIEPDREKVIDKLLQSAGTSILWLYLACKYINLQNQAFEKSVEVISSTKTIAEVVHRLVASMHLDQDAKDTMSLVLTAERPLLFDEVKLLLQAQPDRLSMMQRSEDLQSITTLLSPFVLVTEGLVAVRHNAIKRGLIEENSNLKWLIHKPDRHVHFLQRMMIYASTCLLGENPASLEPLESKQMNGKLRGHILLEYTVRYWAIHFKKTSHYKQSGTITLPKDFKLMFPNSVMFALLEEGCWTTQLPPLDAVNLHITAYRVRETMYGPDKACVLQNAITIAKIFEVMLSRTSDATEWYFKALKACFKISGVHSEMTLVLCHTVLRLSERHVVGKRCTIMDWREEVMLMLINIYTRRFGAHSKEVIEIRRMIIEFYLFIHEEHRCEEHRKCIEGEIIVGGNGPSLQGDFAREGKMTLKRHKHKEVIDYFEEGFFDGYTSEGVEIILTFEMVQQILILITGHIDAGRLEKAEELYIELWIKLTEYCQGHHEVDWHAKKIEIMIAYCRFLHTHHRSSEASAILLCIWREYEHHETTSFELINVLLKEVAVFMKVLGIFTTALAVFRKCWSWFKYAHKEHTVVFKEIETSITIISTEIVKTSTTTQTSETIIREIFESTLSSSETITSTTIELCRSLTSTYIREERYSEAILCIESCLRKSWASFFFESDLSIAITSENIELVMHLAHCYLSQKRYEKVEEIYIRLYRVHRKTHSCDHELVIKYSEMLLKFYKEQGLFTKAISFYQELLVEYRIHYGASHEITIRILYALGDHCRKHHITHGYWIEYYLEIVNVLNKGSLYCHEEALRALIIVAEHHYEALRYSEAMVYFKSIFATFCKHGLTYKYFEHMVEVQKLIEHYFRSIEESQIEIEIHITLVKDLRHACLKCYGESSTVTLSTSLVLATVYRRSEKYEFEAISLYEHISQHSTSKEVRTSLQYLYYKRITTSTTEVTTEIIEKAVTMTYEQYIHIRKEHSCIHEKTLSVLKQLVQLWFKQSKTELIIKELRTIIIEIISKVKKSEEFVETGKFLAEIFIFCGYQKHAFELVNELRRQVIYKVVIKESTFNVISVDRACLAFIASFEYYVRANWSLTLSVLMADLIAEYSFYHRFIASIKAKATIDVIFSHGARLRRILVRGNRMVDFEIVENEMIKHFVSHEVAVMKHCPKSAVKIFVTLLLRYCSTHQLSKTFTATAGHAAIAEIESLLKQNKQKEAVELTRCTFYFLMAHEGLDDPTEITMGFRLSLLMGGRLAGPKPNSAMLELSRVILAEVFTICKNYDINIARIHLHELNEVIEMIGEQKDYERLHWLLRILWTSRESQTKWPKDAVLKLGMRLVQAEFAAGHTASAIRLCEDIVYNIRRVYGPRHQSTLGISELLASLYTSIGVKHRNGTEKRDAELARFYFKKALAVQEDALKAFVGWEETDQSDDDDDYYSEHHGSTAKGSESNGNDFVMFNSEKEKIETAIRHLRKLRLAMQRLGGWTKAAQEFERLTDSIWNAYGPDMKLKEDEVRCGHWKAEKLGEDVRYDCFDVPHSWSLVAALAA